MGLGGVAGRHVNAVELLISEEHSTGIKAAVQS